MRCQHEDYYDDMYPEFAPEPIVVRCDQVATHCWTFSQDMADEGGFPTRGVREVVRVWSCTEHATLFVPDTELWGPWNATLIGTTVLAPARVRVSA